MADFPVPAELTTHTTLVKKSKFITYLAPMSDQGEFKQWLNELRALHPGANHHCWAHILGTPDDMSTYGFSDDGEPSGAAGMPMLKVLQGSNLGNVAAIVVRYFGGVKLGKGGMARAYGLAVRETLELLTTIVKRDFKEVHIRCSYPQQNTLLHLLQRVDGKVKNQEYTEEVNLVLLVPLDELQSFSRLLQEAFQGDVEFETMDI